jgi:hypothetical protein
MRSTIEVELEASPSRETALLLEELVTERISASSEWTTWERMASTGLRIIRVVASIESCTKLRIRKHFIRFIY